MNFVGSTNNSNSHACKQRQLRIEDFSYVLPEEKIALYPLKERDLSKLLVYKNGEVKERIFRNIDEYLPERSLLIMNNTKVVCARLVFFKEAGARIEIFCLEQVEPTDIALAFSAKSEVIFKCFIGNNKKWKQGILSSVFECNGQEETLKAERLRSEGEAYIVKFTYSDKLSFSEVLEAVGKVPLPPYIHRQAEERDKETYQTVFAKYDGSVAAPTAGLHFTTDLLAKLENKEISKAYLTLHVGAGTFKPVKESQVGLHLMHREYVEVSKELLFQIKEAIENKRPIIPVGTTSMRTLESLYWWGVGLKDKTIEESSSDGVVSDSMVSDSVVSDSVVSDSVVFELGQWKAYEEYGGELPYSPIEVVNCLLDYMQKSNKNSIKGYTALMIAPAYKFAFCKGIITNFHQPQSTLLLLVAALIGEKWKELYSFALENDFRFLSYGDSCLFLPDLKD